LQAAGNFGLALKPAVNTVSLTKETCCPGLIINYCAVAQANTSLWVSTSWKVGLHLQQQQHIKSPLSAWQARHDVSARVVMHTLHKGLQLLQLNLH